MKKRPAVGVEVADRVGEEGTVGAGGAVDRRRVVEELVVRERRADRVPGLVEDSKDRVDTLEHMVRADAQRLVRRFAGELVAAVGQTIVAMVRARRRSRRSPHPRP